MSYAHKNKTNGRKRKEQNFIKYKEKEKITDFFCFFLPSMTYGNVKFLKFISDINITKY